MTAVDKKVFAFASQKKAAANAKAVEPQVVGSFDIAEHNFEILEAGDTTLLYLSLDVTDEGKAAPAILQYLEDALTEDAATRFRKLATGKLGNKPMKFEEILEVFQHVVEVQGEGVPYYAAERLVHAFAEDYLRISGEGQLKGIKVIDLPFGELLTYVYAWITEGADPEQREKIDRIIFDPPASISKEKMAELPMWTAEEMGNSFMATMASRGQRAS